MKVSAIRAELSVQASPKTLALCITMLDAIWSGTERTKLLRTLCFYYGVTL